MLGVAFASDLLLASLALCFYAAFFAALLTVGGQCGVKPHRCTGSRTAGPLCSSRCALIGDTYAGVENVCVRARRCAFVPAFCKLPPPLRYHATSGSAELSCVGARDRRRHGPMYGPRCAVSDTNAWAGVATASRSARTRAFLLRKELQCTLQLARSVCLAHCHYDTAVLRWLASLLVSASFMTGRSIAWVESAIEPAL
jgi:endogenous inhibitor of DNA gyrase (YacG/DUF329 family)